ncbi:MAG: hypothetical protein SVM80_02170 [Halobacteriota archaeon]|nr:hypothetical protein [Halobacteriota archaeon]
MVLVCIGCIALAVEALPHLLPVSVEVEVMTDKEVYHSDNPMKIVVSLHASKEIDDVRIDLEGIKNKRGTHKLIKSTSENLTSGVNNVTFDFITPPCSLCAGLDPGAYYINATVVYDNKTANATHTITLEK